MKNKNSVFIISLFLVLISCSKHEYVFRETTFSVKGSEFIDNTTLSFINDSIVEYVSSTDLVSDKSVGWYKCNNKKLKIWYLDEGSSIDTEFISPYYKLQYHLLGNINDSIKINFQVLTNNSKLKVYENLQGCSYLISNSSGLKEISGPIIQTTTVSISKSNEIGHLKIYYQTKEVFSIPISFATSVFVTFYLDIRYLYYQLLEEKQIEFKIKNGGNLLKHKGISLKRINRT